VTELERQAIPRLGVLRSSERLSPQIPAHRAWSESNAKSVRLRDRLAASCNRKSVNTGDSKSNLVAIYRIFNAVVIGRIREWQGGIDRWLITVSSSSLLLLG
jgi:hypothetical protein